MPFIRPKDVFEPTQDGDTFYSNFSAEDESGALVFCRIGYKSDKGRPVPGVDIEIQPTQGALSVTPSKPTYVRRVQQQGGQRGGYGGQRQNSPVNAQQRPQTGSSPQQAPKAVPTMSQAVAVLGECIEAVKGIGGSDAHATTLFLARLRGDIRRDPTEADVAAAKSRQEAEQARAKAVSAGAQPADLAVGDGKFAAGDYEGAKGEFIAAGAKAEALAAMPAPEASAGDHGIPF